MTLITRTRSMPAKAADADQIVKALRDGLSLVSDFASAMSSLLALRDQKSGQTA